MRFMHECLLWDRCKLVQEDWIHKSMKNNNKPASPFLRPPPPLPPPITTTNNKILHRITRHLGGENWLLDAMYNANTNHGHDIANILSKPTYLVVTPDDILRAGLIYAGFDLARQAINNQARKINWFKSFYGVAPVTIAVMFEDIRVIEKDANVKEFLMALNWLFLYDTYPVLSGRWKFSEEFIMKSVANYVSLMEELSRKKITLELKHDLRLGRSIDCCNFMVQEMRLDPNSKWYDHKSNSCGLVSHNWSPWLGIICSTILYSLIRSLFCYVNMARNMNSVLHYVRQELSGSADHMYHPAMISQFLEVGQWTTVTIGTNLPSTFS